MKAFADQHQQRLTIVNISYDQARAAGHYDDVTPF
jgi:hypothetical protein